MTERIERVCGYLRTLPYIIILKLQNRGNIRVGRKQRWESNCRLIIKQGSIYIGDNCNFRSGLRLRILRGGGMRIGCNCFMNNNVSITAMKKVTIGNNVKIANNVVIVDHDHNYADNNIGYNMGSVVIEDYVWIGANCTILKDTYIGEHSVIAAGSVVIGCVPPYTIYGGVKAKKIKEIK